MLSRVQLIVFFISFLLFSKFSLYADFGWHMAYGWQFLETGKVLTEDKFSWTMQGYNWGNYFFAFQILIYFVFKTFGHVFLFLFFGFLGALGVMLLVPRKLNVFGFFAVIFGIFLSVSTLGVRPTTVSFLMFAVLLKMLEKGFFRNSKTAFITLPFFAIWANFHQGFVVALFFLATFLILDFLSILPKRKDKRIFPRAVFFGGAVLGTLFTPYHMNVWKGIVADLTGPKTYEGISEWGPIAVHFPVNLVYALTAAVFVFVLFKNFKKIDAVWFLSASFILALVFLLSHSMVFWGALFIYLVSRQMQFAYRVNRLQNLPVAFSVSALILAILLNFTFRFVSSRDLNDIIRSSGYPTEASEYIVKGGFGGRIYNDYSWGGYLTWQYPQIKVFIDGRMTGWRDENRYILDDYMKIEFGDCEVFKRYKVSAVLVKKNNKNPCFSDLVNVWEDDVAKVLKSN